jgi:hypothetical protein
MAGGTINNIMPQQIEKLDDQQLRAKLTEILESWPLYNELRYIGSNWPHLPEEIKRFCPQCERETSWKHNVSRNQTPQDRNQYQQRTYRCANCKDQHVWFVYYWFEDTVAGEKFFVFRKYGQWPAIEERLSRQLEQSLKATDDLKYYKTALRLRNFGHGIAAMAYMRRVIESHMSEMLEILNDEAKARNLPQLSQKELASTRFEEKVALAERLFPEVLAPEHYPNPFVQLYKHTSGGLHNLSESECVVLFDQCRHVFEYVFSELRPHLKQHRQFLEELKKLPSLTSTK